jgi:glycosyltransferase involved in cell wall biosynthesis
VKAVAVRPGHRIKVLFVESGRRGGSVFRLKSILERLDPGRFEAGLLSWYRDRAAARLYQVESLFCRRTLGLRGEQPDTIKHLGGLQLPTPFGFYYYLVSRSLIARHQPHVAYFNTGIEGHEPAILAASRAGVPVVCHIRSSHKLNRDGRLAARRVGRFVTSSRWGMQQFAGELERPLGDFDCVYEAIDLRSFDLRARQEMPPPLPDGPLYVCLVGSLIARKRPVLAIQGLAAARGRCPDLRLVLAGEGPLGGEVERQVKLAQLETAVIRLGNVSAVPALLRRCHVGLLASESEGMPNAVMEYMAAGLPVVTSSVPGVDELVDHGSTGLIVPDPLTPQSIADALCELANDTGQRASFGRAARTKIERHEFRPEAEVAGVSNVLVKTAAGVEPGA